jgi:hypothetical protein
VIVQESKLKGASERREDSQKVEKANPNIHYGKKSDDKVKNEL